MAKNSCAGDFVAGFLFGAFIGFCYVFARLASPAFGIPARLRPQVPEELPAFVLVPVWVAYVFLFFRIRKGVRKEVQGEAFSRLSG